MAKYFMPNERCGIDAECAVCFCLWTDPVEVSGCQHIFCRRCVEGLQLCPVCCGAVEQLTSPGKFILRLLERVQGRCSACLWQGSFHDFKEHETCLREGEVQDNNAKATLSAEDSLAMQAYYLEDGGDDVAATVAVAASPSKRQSISYIISKVPAAVGAHLTSAQCAQWRQSLVVTAAEYGMPDREYSKLIDRFPHFAVLVGEPGTPELRWRDACRLLRFFNYPSHPDDVNDLFAMSPRNSVAESVPFHVLCLWLMLNRRNPDQWYRMGNKSYERLLQVAQVLDEKETGLFTLDQCRLLAEEYLERDVDEAEWRYMETLLRGKDADIRYSFVGNSARWRPGAEERIDTSAVKLPLHDALCTFARHAEKIRERQSSSTAKLS